MRILRLLILSALALRVAAAEPAPAGLLIDRVWSGDPVSFALLTEGDHQYVAYYDAERRLTVCGRTLADTRWTRVQPDGVPVPARNRLSNVTGWDSHNYLALALDSAGGLHLAGNMHADPLVYYRTSKPFAVATLERIDRMVGDRERSCTYPVFFKDAAGDLLFRYRDGASGNGSDLYNQYDPRSRTWRRLLGSALLDGQGRRNAYALDPVLGPDGRFHLVWMWRESPDCATNNTLSYARSRDFVHWENSRGEPLALPITRANAEVIDPARPGGGLINMTFNLGFDAQRRPIVVYHRYDPQGRSQAYAARPQPAGGWDIRQISAWNFRWSFSGGGSIPAEVSLGPPQLAADGSLLVDYSTLAAGAGRWRLRADTLETTAELPPLPAVLLADLAQPQSGIPGLEVQTVESRDRGRRWVLRWETLPRNRDQPRSAAPPPTELRLYEFPDTPISSAARVGS